LREKLTGEKLTGEKLTGEKLTAEKSTGGKSTGENQVPQGFSLGSLGPGREGALAPEVCFPTAPSVAAIGPATASALEAIGFTPNLIPPQAVAESLADMLLLHARQADGTPTRFLLIRAEEAREHLPETLRAAGAEVTIASVYRTVIPADSIEAIRELFSRPETIPDAITFTSSSTARNLFALLEAAGVTLPANIAIASIGPITSATLRDLGYPPQVEATETNVASLAENLVKHLRSKKIT
jgi:uroporphyrinogen-III synthase